MAQMKTDNGRLDESSQGRKLPPVLIAFGSAVRVARIKRGWSQRELAEAASLDQLLQNAVQQTERVFDAQIVVLLPDSSRRLSYQAHPASTYEIPGPEQPVALTNPEHEAAAAQREARRKTQEARKLEQKRKREERKIAEQRRQQSIKEARELKAANERSRQEEVNDEDDDDDGDTRPSFFRREPERPFERPFFRLFGGND